MGKTMMSGRMSGRAIVLFACLLVSVCEGNPLGGPSFGDVFKAMFEKTKGKSEHHASAKRRKTATTTAKPTPLWTEAPVSAGKAFYCAKESGGSAYVGLCYDSTASCAKIRCCNHAVSNTEQGDRWNSVSFNSWIRKSHNHYRLYKGVDFGRCMDSRLNIGDCSGLDQPTCMSTSSSQDNDDNGLPTWLIVVILCIICKMGVCYGKHYTHMTGTTDQDRQARANFNYSSACQQCH